MAKWSDGLQEASWRGILFRVHESTVRRGRRVALHEYPYKDTVWVEDMGRAKRQISFVGFLVGDDVIARTAALDAAVEKAGSGDLVHPSLGKRTCVCVEYQTSQRAEEGRSVEINFVFIETSAPTYPDASTSTQVQVGGACTLAGGDIAGDFASSMGAGGLGGALSSSLGSTGGIGGALSYGSSVIGEVASTVTRIANQITAIVRNPVGALLSVTGLGGVASYGRFAFGAVSGAIAAVTRATTAISGLFGGGTDPAAAALLTQASANRAAAIAACAALPAAASTLGVRSTDQFTGAVQTALRAVRLSTTSPAEQVRILGQVVAAATTKSTTEAPGGLGFWLQTARVATNALVRRTACLEMARAAAVFVPSSYDEAADLRTRVTGYLDREITSAGDSGDDRSYEALRTVRSAVAADLTVRGASLARVVDVETRVSTPSLVIAYRLYNDSSRSDELVAEVDPVAPLFMPTSFRAKAK